MGLPHFPTAFSVPGFWCKAIFCTEIRFVQKMPPLAYFLYNAGKSCNTRIITRKEQVSGSSPLVGSLFLPTSGERLEQTVHQIVLAVIESFTHRRLRRSCALYSEGEKLLQQEVDQIRALRG